MDDEEPERCQKIIGRSWDDPGDQCENEALEGGLCIEHDPDAIAEERADMAWSAWKDGER
ncbi:hypothetical protein GCM10010401_07220 [Rarobacter faecitabidus]|uniref:hypothetical protein n=1 Tax=Rarobacter faecitabidus TaxID=13243 RepID=UPI001154BFB0|nr:hypothetical protein [Rarobacter faecitabidus]